MAKKPIGYIYYRSTNEVIKYYDEKRMIESFNSTIFCEGPQAVSFKVYKNNVNLIYELNAILQGEFGIELQKKPFIINHTTPEFKIYDKLKAIYEYEEITNKKKRITQPYNNDYLLKDTVLTMSVKAMKNLIDRRYADASKFTQKQNTPRVKRKKHDPER